MFMHYEIYIFYESEIKRIKQLTGAFYNNIDSGQVSLRRPTSSDKVFSQFSHNTKKVLVFKMAKRK